MVTTDGTYCMLSNVEQSPGIYHAVLESIDAPTPEIKPGQFAMVQVMDGTVPLLRRPLSYLGAGGKIIEFAYRAVGEGTRILSQAKENDRLKILGPLGNGFTLSKVKSRALLVAGGMGIVPMFFLAATLIKSGVHVKLIYGTSTDAEMIFGQKIEDAVMEFVKVTEDGSAGQRGTACDPAFERMRENRPEAVFACGPMGMLKTIAAEASRLEIPCEVSVEARMACGVGACLGCAISKDEGYLHVCSDGPVFDAGFLF